MAEKKLMNIPFSTVDGLYQYNLSCSSSDNMVVDTAPSPTWRNSVDGDKLNQVGCMFYVPIATTSPTYLYPQTLLNKSLTRAQYGLPANGFIPAAAAVGAKLYLYGMAVDEDNNPMPYLSYIQSGSSVHLHYFKADDTELGYLHNFEIGSGGSGNLAWVAGKLYEDGTFIGNAGMIRPHNNSAKYYQWCCTYKTTTPIQFIRTVILDDLKQYLPDEPEGEWSAPEGVGNFDATSDEIDFPGLPSIDVLSTGLCSLYKMTAAQLQGLADFLWSDLFDLDTYKKLLQDPMEAILNLSIMPVDATAAATATAIKVGNITTSANGNKVTSQYKTFNFGTINLNEYWASFADYSPYTKLSIFLPYVGFQQMSIDDVMNGSIQLKAHVDVLTGAIQYILKSVQGNHRGHGHSSVMYTWGGNCQYQVPLSASNMTQVINSIVGTTGSIAGGVGLAAATGGMTAPIAVGMVGSSIANVMNAKQHVQRGGGLGGAVGIFGVQTPYLILERPEEVYPNNYDHTIGQPTEAAGSLNEFSGFVKVKACHLQISGATDTELDMINSMLKEGVLV